MDEHRTLPVATLPIRDARLDHVAVAVRDVRAAMRVYADLLGARFLFGGDQHASGFRWIQFAFPGGGKLELIASLRGGSFVERFIDARGEGIHHVTLKVPDLAEAVQQVRAAGIEPIGVALGDPEWKEAFIHPRDAHGALVQLAESPWTDEQMAEHHLQPHEDAEHHHVSLEHLVGEPSPIGLEPPTG